MKIVASDYDGTIKLEDKRPEKTIDAIEKWQKKGNLFGIVTGRSTATIKEEIRKYELSPDFLICNNGGVILNRELEVLSLNLIDFNEAKKIIEYIEGIECNEYILNDGFHRARKAISSQKKTLHNSPSTVSVEEMMQKKEIAQIVIGFDQQENANQVAIYLNENYEQAIEAFANINCVDIVPKGCSKANGIRSVAEMLDLSLDSISAIGDSYNDLSMLEAFHSATLDHALPEIKACADHVVEDVSAFLDLLENR